LPTGPFYCPKGSQTSPAGYMKSSSVQQKSPMNIAGKKS
jgi:hypothetical protein